MKRMITMLLVLSLLLCACGDKQPAETQPQQTPNETNAPVETKAPEATETQPQPQETEAAGQTVINNREYSFVMDGVTLTPGTTFDASALPAADSVYQIPSCAFEGTDNVYTYPTCELIAYNEGNGEVIYSIYLLDPTVLTPEGLAIGDEEAKVVAAYGTGYNLSDGQYTYVGRNSQLIILTTGGFVESIEYRITEG